MFLALIRIFVTGLLANLSLAWAQSSATNLLSQAQKLGDLYNWADAAPYFAQAEQQFLAAGDQRNAWYAKIGLVRSTMEQLNLPQTSQELATYGSNPVVVNDPQLKMFLLIVKGDIDNELSNPSAARQDWEQVLQIAHSLGDSKWQYRAKGELAIPAFTQGQVLDARKLATEALVGANKAKDAAAELRFLTHIGTGLVLLKSYVEGLPFLERALAVAAANPETGYPFLAKEGKVQALSGLLRYTEAEELAGELLAAARAKQKYVKEAQVLITLAKIARRTGDSASARVLLRQSIQLSERGGFERLLAEAQSQLADVERVAGQFTHAETLAAEAAQHTRTGGDLYLLPDRLRSLAQLKVLKGEFLLADQLYDEAADAVDIMLVNCPTAQLKSMLITAMSQIYTEHFALVADHLRDVVKAHKVLERARGRVTTDLLQSVSLPSTSTAKALDEHISGLHLRLIRAHTRKEVKAIRDEIFLAQQQKWLTLPARTRQTSQIASLDQVRHRLGRDELMLEFVWSEPKSYWLSISRQNARIIPVEGQHRLRPLVDSLQSTMQRKQSGIREGQVLYRALFSVVPEVLTKPRLTIVPDGGLHLVPFDALVSQSGKRLVQTHTITVASSSSTDLLLRGVGSQDRRAATTVLGVGGIPYDGATSKLAITRGYEEGKLGNLPFSRDEVMAAAAAFPSPHNTLLLGKAGTERAFKAALASRQNIVHLAVHGVANRERPERAGLLLLSDETGEDGVLQPHEIAQLPLAADLVVLSACDTAVGRLQGQEGIANLSRAFLVAGAQTVVSTLWSIDDTFSLYLMRRFYAHLSAGRARAEALVRAKRDLIRTFGATAVPYFWAGFVMEGAGDQVLVSPKSRPAAGGRP